MEKFLAVGFGCFLASCTGVADAQVYEGAAVVGGPQFDSANAVVKDAAGNIFVGGSFMSSVDFDPGPAVNTRIAVGSSDAYLLKLSREGVFQQLWTWGTTASESVDALAVDESGNVYVGITASPGASVPYDTDPADAINSIGGLGGQDAFVVKLDAAGDHVAAVVGGGAGNDNVVALTSRDGFLVVAGRAASGTAGFGGTTLATDGSGDVYIWRMNTQLVSTWAISCLSTPTTSSDTPHDVDIDDAGNVYATGSFLNSVQFPSGGATTLTSAGGSDVFFLKIAPNGTLQWARRFGAMSNDQGRGIRLHNERIYLVGRFAGDLGAPLNLVSNGASSDAFVAAFDAATGATVHRARAFGGTGSDQFTRIQFVRDIAYIPGEFAGVDVDFDPGAGTALLSSVPNMGVPSVDPVLAVLGAENLDYVWAGTMGSPQAQESASALAADMNGFVSVGQMRDAADYDPGPGTDVIGVQGNADAFIHRMGFPNVSDALFDSGFESP